MKTAARLSVSLAALCAAGSLQAARAAEPAAAPVGVSITDQRLRAGERRGPARQVGLQDQERFQARRGMGDP